MAKAKTKRKAPKKPVVQARARGRTALDRALEALAETGGPEFTGMRRPSWARFEAFSNADGTAAEIDIYDVIGSYETNSTTFRQQLKAIKADNITVNINSPGGSVMDGFAMYSDLKDHPAKVHVRIRGLAASAASLIAMAGDTIEIADNGFLMIHNATIFDGGDRRTFAGHVKTLTQIDNRLAMTYANAAKARGGADAMNAAEFADLMDLETWFDGQDALDAGLVDTIGSAEPVASFAGLDFAHFAKTPGVLVKASKAPPPRTTPAPQNGVSAALERLLQTLKG